MSIGLSESYPRLVGDIGGTNARFALVTGPGRAPTRMRNLPCARYPGPAEAIRDYLAVEDLPVPPVAAFGIANPVDGDHVAMTNHHWAFSVEGLRATLGLERLLVINDFTALALSLRDLQPQERRQVGGETWLYYPSQPFGRKVLVARLGADGRLIAVEQRLSEEYIAKVIPNQSRRDDVLALFGQPFERRTYPRLQREAWSWHMQQWGMLPAGLHVQLSADGVVREVYVLDERNDSDKSERP